MGWVGDNRCHLERRQARHAGLRLSGGLHLHTPDFSPLLRESLRFVFARL